MNAAPALAPDRKATSAAGARPIRKVVLPGQTPEGAHILSVLVKRSYDICPGEVCVRAAQDTRLHAADIFYVDPMNSSVRFESDYVPFKLATDIVLNGTVYAPGGNPATHVVAELSVDGHRKRIGVIGDRVCHFRAGDVPVFGEPTPFATMELCYERAYGGVDIYSDPRIPFPYVRNPVGKGFAIKNTEKSIENLLLPNIEDLTNLLKPEHLCCDDFALWEQQPMPAGFGWLSKTWPPRAQFAGIMPADRAVEQELREVYTKLVPQPQRELYAKTALPDMNFNFFNGASPGLVLPFLSGGETIRTLNLTPEGDCIFYLSGDKPRIRIDIGDGLVELPVIIQTVMIRMEDRQVDIVTRGAIPYPGPDWFTHMQTLQVFVE
jgi:hypothetical protein